MVKYAVVFIINFSGEDKISSYSHPPSSDQIFIRDNTRNQFVFNIKDKAKQYVHIKYKSFTQRIDNNIYIVCTGKIAKVFTDQGSVTTKVVDLYKNQNCLVFKINHDDKITSREDAMKYSESRASFEFEFNKAHLAHKIGNENLASTYVGKIPEQDITTDSGHVIPKTKQFVELQEANVDSKSGKSANRSSSNHLIPDHQQTREAYDTIVGLAGKSKFFGTGNVHIANNDKTETANPTVHLSGKSLFYDEQFFKTIINTPATNNCNNIAVIIDAGSFYDADMKKYFVPLVLRIPRLNLLPIQDLRDLNIKNLYLQSDSKANVLFTKELKIGPIPVDKCDVNINYKNVFFINVQNVTAVAEFLLSESVVFKLVCDPAVAKTPDTATLYGGRAADAVAGDRKQFSAHRKYAQLLDTYRGRHPHVVRLPRDGSHAAVVGCAAFDLSALVRKSQRTGDTKVFGISRQAKSLNEYVFKEHKLHEYGIYLELSVHLGNQLSDGLNWNNVLFLQNYMNRAVIVCQHPYIWELIKFYKGLIEHNDVIISSNQIETEETSNIKMHGLFSGYIIDCVDYTIMFVEGIHNALRTKLAGHFIEHEPTILYDRTMIFEKV